MSVVLAGFLIIWLLVYAWGAARWALKDVDRLFEQLAKDGSSIFAPSWQVQWRVAASSRGCMGILEAMVCLGEGLPIARSCWRAGDRVYPNTSVTGAGLGVFWVGNSIGMWAYHPSAEDCAADDWYVVTPHMLALEKSR